MKKKKKTPKIRDYDQEIKKKKKTQQREGWVDDLHYYTHRENSMREAKEHNSLVKNLEKK